MRPRNLNAFAVATSPCTPTLNPEATAAAGNATCPATTAKGVHLLKADWKEFEDDGRRPNTTAQLREGDAVIIAPKSQNVIACGPWNPPGLNLPRAHCRTCACHEKGPLKLKAGHVLDGSHGNVVSVHALMMRVGLGDGPYGGGVVLIPKEYVLPFKWWLLPPLSETP